MASRFPHFLFAAVFIFPSSLRAQAGHVRTPRSFAGVLRVPNALRTNGLFAFQQPDQRDDTGLEKALRLWGTYWTAQSYFTQTHYTPSEAGIPSQPIAAPISDFRRELPGASLPGIDE